MNESFFVELVRKWFAAISSRITETWNGKKEEPTYLHEKMLKREYSSDLKWEAINANRSVVAADVVAMDSPLPLKKRDSLGAASGNIPKIGMKLTLNESDITKINIMRRSGTREAVIVEKIFTDTPKCAKGVKERLEDMFLSALSTGACLIQDSENVGIGVRANYRYLDVNKHGVSVAWGQSGYTPLSNVAKVIEEHNDLTFVSIYLSRQNFNLMRQSQEGKELSANFSGMVIINSANLPTPTPEKFKEAFLDEYGIKLVIIDRTVKYEIDGKRYNKKPFDANTLVFLTSEEVGTLTWGTLAEVDQPVAGVEYQTVDEYILLSKYSKNDPLREFTSSQALAIPVIENVSEIVLLKTDEVEIKDSQTENDAEIDLWEGDYDRSDVIAALAALEISVSASISDADLVTLINELSAAKKKALKAAIVPYPGVSSSSLTFAAAGEAKTFTVTAPGDVTLAVKDGNTSAASAANWATVSNTDGTVTVTASQNSGAARSAYVWVTSNGKTRYVALSQASGL